MSDDARITGIIELVGLDKAQGGLKGLATQTDAGQRKVDELEKSAKKASAAFTGWGSTTKAAATGVDGVAKRSTDAKTKIDGLARSTTTASSSTKRLASSSGAASAQLAGMERRAMSAGRVIAASLGVGIGVAGIVRLGSAVVRTGMTFDETMSGVRATSNATAAEFQALRGAAIQMGGSTVFSATEVGGAMVELGKAGFSAKQQLAGIGGVLDAAAASGEDMASVSTVMVDTLGGFKMAAASATHVADGLARVANETTAGIGDLGESMKYVAPVAASVGMTFDQTAASFQVLAESGIKGSMAGTALRGVLVDMQAPNKVVQKQMDDMGLSFRDASGKMLPFSTNIDRLRAKLEKMPRSKADKFLKDLFGSQQITAARAFLDAGSEGLDKLTREIAGANGEAKKMASTMTDNLAGDVESLTGALESAAITISDMFRPQFRAAVGEMQAWVSSDAFAEQAARLAGSVGSAAQALASGAQFAYQHRDAITALAVGYGTFRASTIVATAAQSAMNASLVAGGAGGAAGGVGKLSAAMRLAGFNPYIAGLAAVAGGVYLIDRAQKRAREEDERYRQSGIAVAEAAVVRRRAADRVAKAADAVRAATMNVQDAEKKYGDGSPQYAAAQQQKADAVAKHAAEQERLNAAVSASKDAAGGAGSGGKDNPAQLTGGEKAAATASLIETEAKLNAKLVEQASLRQQLANLQDASRGGKGFSGRGEEEAASAAYNIEKATRALDKLNAAYDEGAITASEFADQYKEHQSIINDGRKAIDTATEKLAENSGEVKKLEAEQRKLNAALDPGGKKAKELAARLDDLKRAAPMVVASARSIRAQLDAISAVKVTPQVARELLTDMSDSERVAKFGTASVNQILEKAGLVKPSPRWGRGVGEEAGRGAAAAGRGADAANRNLARAGNVRASTTWMNSILGQINAVRQQASRPITMPRPGSAGFIGPVPRRATGGPIYGAGSSTSDSIPAMLSNGEFVMRAAAVDKYGLGFMDAVNRGQVLGLAKGGAAWHPEARGKQRFDQAQTRWDALSRAVDARGAATDLRMARAERTPGTRDDIGAHQQAIRDALWARGEMQGFLTRNSAGKGRFKQNALSQDLRTQIVQAITAQERALTDARGAIRGLRADARLTPAEAARERLEKLLGGFQSKGARLEAAAAAAGLTASTADDASVAKKQQANALAAARALEKFGGTQSFRNLSQSDRDSYYQALAGARRDAAGRGSSAGGGGADTSLAAQLEQARLRAERAEANYRLGQGELRAFGSTGDIGSGGRNALGAVRSAPVNINVYSLTGSDPAIQQQVAQVVDGGFSSGASADIAYSGVR